MKNVVGIAEIVLWTVDQPRALAFYRDLLGLEVISRAGMANVFLKVGEGNAGIPQMIVLVPKPDGDQGPAIRLSAAPPGAGAARRAVRAAARRAGGGRLRAARRYAPGAGQPHHVRGRPRRQRGRIHLPRPGRNDKMTR